MPKEVLVAGIEIEVAIEALTIEVVEIETEKAKTETEIEVVIIETEILAAVANGEKIVVEDAEIKKRMTVKKLED